VKNGEIVLSVSQQATRDLTIGNDLIQFSARFNGVSREISVPIYAVQAIFARENGQGMFFEVEAPLASTSVPTSSPLSVMPSPASTLLSLKSAPTSPPAVHPPTLQPVPKRVTSEPVANASDAPDPRDAREADSQSAAKPSSESGSDAKPPLPPSPPPSPTQPPPRGKLRVVK
jgi:hypothetical protein